MVTIETKKAELRVYTREAEQDSYPGGLAHSIHMACRREGGEWQPLHQNYGILFATSRVRKDDTIRPFALKEPWIMELPTSGKGAKYYGVAAYVEEETDFSGGLAGDLAKKNASEIHKIALWTTKDFTQFREEGMFEEDDYFVRYPQRGKDTVEIDAALCDKLTLRWGQLHSVDVRVPKAVTVTQPAAGQQVPAELANTQATVVYSDGSTDEKRVNWDWAGKTANADGSFLVKGKVVRERYPFPLTKGYGDPVFLAWEGKYYYLATNDNVNDIGLYLREADDMAGLFSEGCKEHIILDVNEEKGFVQTFWAPEFHVIGGELYILFAVSGKEWGPQCHMMRLKKGGALTDPNAWEAPVRVVRKDGGNLSNHGITLDMTYIKAGGRSYLVWSFRRGIGTALDTGSMLYIAETDEKEPWKLTSEPTLLSRPLYGWENVRGTINNEGPQAFVANGKVYLTYSGGDACGYTYAVGLLTAEENADLLDAHNWKKNGYPVLHFMSVEGEFGPGHNSFFVSPEGKLMIAYHAEDAIASRLRCAGMHRVHFDLQGDPVFDLSADRDLAPQLEEVQMIVSVK